MSAVPAERRAELLALVESAQRAAGILAARHRGDAAGTADLLGSMDDRSLASGSLLLAELAIGLYRSQTGQSIDACLSELCVQLEAAVGAR